MTGQMADRQIEHALAQLDAPPLRPDFYVRLRAQLSAQPSRRARPRIRLWSGMLLAAALGSAALAALATVAPRSTATRATIAHAVHGFTTAFSADTSSWRTAARLPTGRDEPAVAALAGRVYVFGGAIGGRPSRSVVALAPSTGRWQSQPPMPHARAGAAAVAAGGRIYLVGGDIFPVHGRIPRRQPILVFTPRTGSWTDTLVPPGPPRNGAAVAAMTVGGHPTLFVFGVLGPSAAPAPNLSYDTITGRWTRLPAAPIWLSGTTAQSVGRSIYLLGGARAPGYDALSTVYAYNPAERSFSRRAAIPHRVQGVPLTSASADGRIYLVASDVSGRRVDVYDPRDDAWKTAPRLARRQPDAIAASLDQTLYAIGGSTLVDHGNAVAPIRTVERLSVMH